MNISVEIIAGPLPPPSPALALAAGSGAVLQFEGIVRPLEDHRPLIALDYEVYEPMASHQLSALAAEIVRTHGLIAIDVRHSRGRVPVGACSFRLTIHSPHRKEALAAADEFIDRMKRDVAIWKTPVWSGVERADRHL